MTGLILVVGRDVLIPLALAVLIWQLINAIAARYRKFWLRGHAAERWAPLALGVLTIIVALASVVHLIVNHVGAVSVAATVGMALGPWLGGALYDSLGSYAWMFIGSSAIGLGAVVIALTFRPPRALGAPVLAARPSTP